MYFGVCYYPEHWGEERWEIDLREMRATGFNMVRIAEFAWCRLEPQDGVYDFEWLDRFLGLCDQYDMDVMMGLPVRLVPAWLFQKDSGMGILNYDGIRETFGTRYTTCLSNTTLQDYALRLTRVMAGRYSKHKRVVNWQLDNEYGHASTCYCEACRQSFIAWLKEKYGTLGNLNQTWGLSFWSMELTDWSQVWLPSSSNHFQKQPSLLLDYDRFTSDKTVKMIRMQCDIVREICPDKPITTNIQSTTREHTDYFKSCAPLDIVSTNYYPLKSYNTIDLDLSRGLLQKNFWVVEQKSGAPGSQHCSPWYSRPGETRMYTYQSIAHGADMVLYYRWRPSYFGNEQFYMGVRGYDGGETRISREIAQVGRELPAVMQEVEGTAVKNDLALMFSPDSRWAMHSFRPTPNSNYRNIFLSYYLAIQSAHIGMDIVGPQGDISRYRTLILPMTYVMDCEQIERIRTFVQNGGCVIASPRCGSKDTYSRMTPTILPPALSELFGIKIDEVLALQPEERVLYQTAGGVLHSSSDWAELLAPTTAKVLADYPEDWYKGYAAMTENRYGRGRAIFLGVHPEEAFLERELIGLLAESGIEPLATGSPAVQATCRVGEKAGYLFLLNTAHTPQEVLPATGGEDLITGKMVMGRVELQPHDVLILRREQ